MSWPHGNLANLSLTFALIPSKGPCLRTQRTSTSQALTAAQGLRGAVRARHCPQKMDTSTLVSTLRHRRKLFLSLLAVSLLVLLGFGHPRVREHASTLWDDRIGRGDEPAASKGLGGGHGPAGGYTRIVGGLDGFFVLENVFVKDRRLCELCRIARATGFR